VRELGAVDYLVKPLDIGQIVPAVQAVLARLREASAASTEAPVASTPTATATERLAAGTAMAVGVLMHRFSLTRDAALARLQRMAAGNHRPVADEAELLLEAVERLSVPAAD